MKICKPLIVVILLSLLLQGCAGQHKQKPRDFKAPGMTITLTENFMKKSYESLTAYYESPDSIVTVLKEEYDLFLLAGIEPETYTAFDYAEYINTNNMLGASVVTENGVTSMTYQKEVGGDNFTYFATVFKTSDAFWLIQFATFTENFDKLKPDFIKYAQSVKFE